MDIPSNRLIGIGLYSVSEAAHLTRIPAASIRRWLVGYRYTHENMTRNIPSVCESDAPSVDDIIGLSFLDMMEMRFIHAFRENRISLQTIREAARRACELFRQDHPFTRKRFSTDGRRIFAEIAGQSSPEPGLLDLVKSQYAFHRVLKPTLYKSLEFSEGDEVRLWYPMWPRRQVVVDPERSFGRPLVDQVGVPTEVLAQAVNAEGSVERVARWFDVPVAAVTTAVDFEQALAS